MENQELDIPILSYLDGEMNAEQKNAFEISMSKNEILRQTVAEYKIITSGVKDFSKKQMKADLLKAQTRVIAAQSLENYKPSINGSGGFNIISTLVKLLILGGLGALAFIYFSEKPKNNEILQDVYNKMHSFDTIFETRYDTVWTIIPTEGVKPGDTVIIRNDEDLKDFKNGSSGGYN